MQEEDFTYLYALEESFWWFAGMREITSTLLDPVLRPSQDRLILDVPPCSTAWLNILLRCSRARRQPRRRRVRHG